MANIFTTAFVINGVLNSSFTSSFGRANKQIGNISKYIGQVKVAQTSLNASFLNGVIGLDQYKHSMDKYQNTLTKSIQKQAQMQRLISNKQYANKAFVGAKNDLMGRTAAVAVFAGGLLGAIKTATGFESVMSKVGAITGATGSDFDLLTQTARKLGEQTQFSAKQAAEAMTYLGMAGWKTEEIVKGMPGLLSLAAAGGTDLARTADIISDELTAFGLTAASSSHMADVFATTITNTNTDVEKLGETMKYSAPVAHAFGVSLEETAALAGIMAGSGIKASMAGTSLRAGFSRLAGPPKMAQKALDSLGMSLQDLTTEQKEAAMAMETLGIKTGNTEGASKMSIILQQLREKMQGFSNDEKIAMAKAIFGQNAFAGWLAVINSAPETFDNLVASLNNCDGAAEKVAKRMNSNAKGASIRLQSAYESLQISLANGLLPGLADLGDRFAVVTGNLSALATKFPGLVQGVTLFAAGIAALYVLEGVVGVLVTAFNAARTGVALYTETMKGCTVATKAHRWAVVAWHRSAKLAAVFTKAWTIAQGIFNTVLLACPIGWVLIGIAALVVAGTLLYQHWEQVKDFFTSIWDSPMAQLLLFCTGPIGILIWSVSGIIANWDTIKDYFSYLWDNPSAAIFRFTDYIKNKFTEALDWVHDKWKGISDFLSTPIFGSINISRTANNIRANANGGIYSEGGFLTSFAEPGTGGESAIGHKPTQRNISLWERTGEILGVGGGSGRISINAPTHIAISGTTDDSTLAKIAQICEKKNAELEAMLRDIQRQRRRVAYD